MNDADTGNTPSNTPPQSRPAPPPSSVTVARPMIVAILYLLNFALGFSVLVGLVLAYIWRGEEETLDWERTHYTYLIRTFWIGLVIFVVTMVLWFASFAAMTVGPGMNSPTPGPGMFIGIFAMFGAFIIGAAWFAVRCILSLAKSGSQRPMPRPKTWLF